LLLQTNNSVATQLLTINSKFMKKNYGTFFIYWFQLKKMLRIMKLSLLLILAGVLNSFAGGFSQDVAISVAIENGTLADLFNVIEKTTDYKIFYKSSLIDDTKSVNIVADQKPVSFLLTDVLSDRNLTFDLVDKVIIITSTDERNQQLKITGKVTDAATGDPLPGVYIRIEGTNSGTISDMNGQYTLEVEDVNAIIQFSFIGYNTENVTVTGKSVINVALVSELTTLEEVIVVGYGTQKKVNLTGSVATIDSKKIENVPVANTTNTLVGRLPGLIAVNRGGQPGYDDASISIRGFNNMLVIVDGVEQPFNNIDPNEIENISILKDASASIYGARAGNGVILVTTKRGESGKPKFNFNSYYGVQTPTRTPKMVDAPTYARMFNDAEIAAGRDPLYTNEEIEKYRTGTDPLYPNTDWYNETFRKWSPISQYNLNTSGGGEQTKYFFSLGYMNQEGMLKSGDSRFQRYNMRSNIDAKITDALSVSLDVSGRLEQRNFPGASIDRIMEGLYFSRPTYAAQFPDPTKIPFVGQSGYQPVAMSDKNYSGYSDDNRKYFLGILSLKYKLPFIEGLSAKASFSYGSDYLYNKDWKKEISVYNYDRTADSYSVANVFGKNQLDEGLSKSSGLTTQLFLNYDKTWKEHNLAAMVVGEFIEGLGNSFGAHREGYITTAIDQMFAGEDLNKNNYGSAWQSGRIGYAGRLNYSYASKYLAEATFRYDASAKFNEDNRWGFFPSFSLGWRISEESFMSNLSSLDNLKLRASYGRAGNDYVGNYNYLTGYMFNSNYVLGTSPALRKGVVSKGLANPELTWESTTTSNLGLDASFLKGLIGFEVDVFYRKVTDVPGYRSTSLPSTFGASLPEENLNSYDDRGFEAVLRHKNSFGDFTYNVEGTFSYARSKWIHFDEPVFQDEESKSRLQQSGQWRNRWFGYEALGFFQSQAEIDNWTVIQDNNDNSSLKPGDIKYADYNNDGILNYKDEHVIGRGTTPEIIYGLALGAEYKGFDLAMLWQGATHFNANFTGITQSPFFNGQVPLDVLSDYWTPENTDAKYPRMYPGGATNNKFESTFWLQDASYLRLKNLQIGYTFPRKLFTRLKIETLKTYVSAYNLITIDKVYPYDPETGTSRGWHYPQQKSVSVGINLTF